MAIQLLLADDSVTIAKILGMALQSEPYVIRSVLTAEDALRELKASPPFFFLVDLSLPEKNGYEFARLIKADSKLRDIRVVLLASAFEPVDEAEYQACGADGMVKKPFDPGELRATLRSIQESPHRFPDGSKVTGSLSGFLVSSPEDSTAANILAPNRNAPTTVVHDTITDILHGEEVTANNDADSILAGLLGSSNEDAPPPFKGAMPSGPLVNTGKTEFTNATVILDLSEQAPPSAPPNEFDLSKSFSTPPGGTAFIDVQEAPSGSISAPPSPTSLADEPLSANAQALAAFFDAEIKSKNDSPAPAPAAPAPAPVSVRSSPVPEMPQNDPFDASLGSIEWDGGGPANESLNDWSSSPPKGKPSEAPPPFQASGTGASTTPPRQAPKQATPRSQSGGAELLFDTGGSSFRFSEDYINRITKSFTGDPFETVPTAAPGMFPQQSDDRKAHSPAPTAAPVSPPSSSAGGGAWSEGDVARIEKIVREEVQMVVREVAEKIAWEVIPELAENLIRKELEKVMKEMGN